MLSKIQELLFAHLRGRKFLAFLVTSGLIFIGGLIPSVQPVIIPVTGSLLGALGIFITGHTMTDIKGSSPNASLKTE